MQITHTHTQIVCSEYLINITATKDYFYTFFIKNLVSYRELSEWFHFIFMPQPQLKKVLEAFCNQVCPSVSE